MYMTHMLQFVCSLKNTSIVVFLKMTKNALGVSGNNDLISCIVTFTPELNCYILGFPISEVLCKQIFSLCNFIIINVSISL